MQVLILPGSCRKAVPGEVWLDVPVELIYKEESLLLFFLFIGLKAGEHVGSKYLGGSDTKQYDLGAHVWKCLKCTA